MANQQTSSGLDEIDFSIIGELSGDPSLSNKAIAQRLGIAESTCAYRLRRLRESGVVRSRAIDVDHAQLGYPLQAVIVIFLARHTREVVDEFMEHMRQQPNVLNVVNLTGRFDFMVNVAVADAEQLRAFVLDRVTVLPYVRGTETHIVFNVRQGTWIPGIIA